MQGAVWDRFLSDRDRAVFSGAGYGVRAGMPTRPAMVLLRNKIEDAETLATLAELGRVARLPVIHVVQDPVSWTYEPERPEDSAPGIRPSDLVIERSAPSAFFDTDLVSFLTFLRADGVILAGAETSDGIRATAVDAFSQNLRSVVVSDACFDRWEASHALALFDLDAKHSDVVDLEELRSWLKDWPSSAFELPESAP